MPRRLTGEYFKSSEQTGTGTEQSIAHTIGRVPSLVIVVPTSTSNGHTFVEGTHTATAIKVTASSGATYKVIAL